MTIYTDTALKEYLEQAGFCQIQSHKNKKGLAVRYSAEMRGEKSHEHFCIHPAGSV